MSSASDPDPHAALHVLSHRGDALAAATLARLSREPGVLVRVFDLTVAEPDYDALLDAIFAADSIVVW